MLVCNSIKLSAIAQISCPAFPFARLYYNYPYSASLAFNHFSSAAGRIDRTKIQQQQHYRRSSSPNMQMYIANARQESELFFFLGIYLFIYFFARSSPNLKLLVISVSSTTSLETGRSSESGDCTVLHPTRLNNGFIGSIVDWIA